VQLGELWIEVVRKDIRNVHLNVMPPEGSVRIAAPAHLSDDAIRAFAIGKLGWIRQQQRRLQGQARELPREYIERESHYVWGRRLLLTVTEADAPPKVELTPSRLLLQVRAQTPTRRRDEILQGWYRAQVRAEAAPLIARWSQRMGVQVMGVFVQKMKTKWGSCNPTARTIRLNTDLAKKPRECLEYVIVHEMTHLLEPTHSARFIGLMDGFMPSWRSTRQALNLLPVPAPHPTPPPSARR
jgi:predicted metal-dependent hydrolase